MRVPDGCAICGATWGDYWDQVEGQRMFFCCDICAIEFKNMVKEVKERTGWKIIDEIKMKGDYRGRECTAFSGDTRYSFVVNFNSKGGIETFQAT